MNHRLGLVASLLLTVLGLPAAAEALPLETLKPGVVKLYVTRADGLDDTGAGIVIGINKGALFIVTAYHVVEDAESIEVIFDSERWTAYPAEPYRHDESMDVATILVRFEDPAAVPANLPTYQTRIGDPIYDERVTAIGHPSDNLEWHPSAERVAQAVSEDPNSFLITRSQSDRGFSGGPVFDDDGALLGVVLSVSGQQTKAVLLQAVLRKLEFWNAPHDHLGTGDVEPRDPGDPDPAEAVPTEIEVPDAVKLTQAKAIEALVAAGLRVGDVDFRETARAEPDVVLLQRPRAGTRVAPGTAVDLQVSRAETTTETPSAPTQVEVPPLVRMSQRDAETVLLRAGLRVGNVTTKAMRGTYGVVLEQSVRAGTRVRPRTAVDLVVSGPLTATTFRPSTLQAVLRLSFREDCQSFDPDDLAIDNPRGSWKIVEGGRRWLFDFADNQAEARLALWLIRHYGMNEVCYVGRPDASLTYLKASGRAPNGSFAKEDCVSFDAADLAVQQLRGRWKITSGRSLLFDFGSSKTEADQSLEVIKRYGFTHSCYVGRPDPSFEYLRR